MNFLDTYDITGGSGSDTPVAFAQPEQSLNEEVSQVIGQLGRFWGGFTRQSQTAFETARKDLGQVVSQASKELSKLTAETPKEPSPEEKGASSEDDSAEAGPSSNVDTTPSSLTPEQQATPASSTGIQTLFSRLQSSLPPNIVSTVQNNLPETLKHASENIDLAQLRTTLSAEFQRVQGVTRAQAEEYVHKSEGLLREAMKEAGEVLREAVKVVPPEEASSSGGSSGFVWDGTDMWMLPSTTPGTPDGVGKGKGRASESDGRLSGRSSGDAQRAVATRAEALLKKLKCDPEVIQVDPEAVETTKDVFNDWVKAEVEGNDNGLDGEEWIKKIKSALDGSADGDALQTIFDALVPSQMTKESFWKRYFFRVYQIEQEEQKRKALLQGTIENEEEFTWEDDEEDVGAAPSSLPPTQSPRSRSSTHSQTPIEIASSQLTLNPSSKPSQRSEPSNSAPSSQAVTPATTSPRDSSEDSYDLVSSGNVSVSERREAGDGDGDSAESDWE